MNITSVVIVVVVIVVVVVVIMVVLTVITVVAIIDLEAVIILHYCRWGSVSRVMIQQHSIILELYYIFMEMNNTQWEDAHIYYLF